MDPIYGCFRSHHLGQSEHCGLYARIDTLRGSKVIIFVKQSVLYLIRILIYRHIVKYHTITLVQVCFVRDIFQLLHD